MRFRITLQTLSETGNILPVNYPYPLSAAIYRILHAGDAAYAHFLHDKGYGSSLKQFKLFCFSDIRTPFTIQSDRLIMKGRVANFLVSFHLPEAASHFIKGLFLQQNIEIADRKSRCAFQVIQVEQHPLFPSALVGADLIMAHLSLLSPVYCGVKNERGNYDFLSPDHPGFAQQLRFNWLEKCRSVWGEAAASHFADASIEPIFTEHPPKSRLVTVKADTAAETRLRGFTHFRLQVQGRRPALELLLNAGVGLYNSSVGGGCCEVIRAETVKSL